MNTIEILAYVAAFCTTGAFVPQTLKVYKTRKTDDLSFGTFLLLSVGLLLWAVYGIIVISWPIILANGITLIMALYIFVMKLTNDRKKT